MPIVKIKLSTLKSSFLIPVIISGYFSSNIYSQIVSEGNKSSTILLHDFLDNRINATSILDLSSYNISNIGITLKHVCSPQKQSIYSNAQHNIPLLLSLNAVEAGGRKITTDQNCEGNCIILDSKTFLKSTELQIEGGIAGFTTLHNTNEYTRCIGETSIQPENAGLYLAINSPGNERLTVSAKLKYKNNKGEVKHLYTDDSEKKQVDTLPNPYDSSSNTSLFSIRNIFNEVSSSVNVWRDSYKFYIISPNLKEFPSLANSSAKAIQLINKDINVSTNYQNVQFSNLRNENSLPLLSNYAVELPKMNQPEYHCNRIFHSGYFISGKLNPLGSSIELKKEISVHFSLSELGKADYGLATISFGNCLPGLVWEYQWEVPFLLNFTGKDVYGNTFQATLDNFLL